MSSLKHPVKPYQFLVNNYNFIYPRFPNFICTVIQLLSVTEQIQSQFRSAFADISRMHDVFKVFRKRNNNIEDNLNPYKPV